MWFNLQKMLKSLALLQYFTLFFQVSSLSLSPSLFPLPLPFHCLPFSLSHYPLSPTPLSFHPTPLYPPLILILSSLSPPFSYHLFHPSPTTSFTPSLSHLSPLPYLLFHPSLFHLSPPCRYPFSPLIFPLYFLFSFISFLSLSVA